MGDTGHGKGGSSSMGVIARYPIILLERSASGFEVYESYDDLEKHLEAIDVNNKQYVAWDSLGRVVELVVIPGIVTESTIGQAIRQFLRKVMTSSRVRAPSAMEKWLSLKVSNQIDASLAPRISSFLRDGGTTVEPNEQLSALIDVLRHKSSQC